MYGEISHIAVVQLYGWITNEDDTDKAVRARAFSSADDAIDWASKVVSEAHGEDADVVRDTNDGAIIRSPSGPTWGFVVPSALGRLNR